MGAMLKEVCSIAGVVLTLIRAGIWQMRTQHIHFTLPIYKLNEQPSKLTNVQACIKLVQDNHLWKMRQSFNYVS